MKLKMKFTGQAVCKKTNTLVKWNAGDTIQGEFDCFLDHTYDVVKDEAPKVKQTTKVKATR